MHDVPDAPKHWLGVVSRDHVLRGVGLGICQIGHGKRAPLVRMAPGDGLVYYSPRESLASERPLRAFTAIGRVADEEVWQADEGDFRPWRRRVAYRARRARGARARPRRAPGAHRGIRSGYALRRGLVPLSAADFAVIAGAMGAGAV